MTNILHCIALLSMACYCIPASSIDDNPEMWPGHMQPLASKQVKHDIETLTNYPSPQEFFSTYVKAKRPFLVKGGAKTQPAYKHWSDEYLANFRESMTSLVALEPKLKEDRTAKGYTSSFKKFLDTYKTKPVYMVNPVPPFLMKDVLIPSPLRCSNTAEFIERNIMWMSAGGTKSVLHLDNTDNINCLFRGTKEVLLIDPLKYKSLVPIDKRKGGYSSLDVEAVDFTKYPRLIDVEYVKASMEEGDCLYIPDKWYHQINSHGNKNKQNIAVNIWFDHGPAHAPTECDVSDDALTIDNYFTDNEPAPREDDLREMESAEGEEDDNGLPLISLYNYTLSELNNNKASLEQFQRILHQIPGIFYDESYQHLTMTDEFKQFGNEMFDKLDVNQDDVLDSSDMTDILDDVHMADVIEDFLYQTMDKMTAIVVKQLEEEDGSTRKRDTAEESERIEKEEL